MPGGTILYYVPCDASSCTTGKKLHILTYGENREIWVICTLDSSLIILMPNSVMGATIVGTLQMVLGGFGASNNELIGDTIGNCTELLTKILH